MAVSPRIVTADVVFLWDGVSQRLPKGQVLDVVPGSALERAIGAGNLIPLGSAAAPPAPHQGGAAEVKRTEAAPQKPQEEKKPAAPPAPPAAAKKQDTAEGGGP